MVGGNSAGAARLLTINTATGAAAKIGNDQVVAVGVAAADVVWDGTRLLGIVTSPKNATKLYSINTATGALTEIGDGDGVPGGPSLSTLVVAGLASIPKLAAGTFLLGRVDADTLGITGYEDLYLHGILGVE